MTFEFRPVTETDLPTFTHLECIAFTSGIGHVLVGPATADNEATVLAKHAHALRTDSTARFLKVVDTVTGQTVAAAKWNCYPSSCTDKELQGRLAAVEIEPAHAAIMEYIIDARRELMGRKPHFILQLLFTHPEHFRRGAAALLVQWGTERADELGLECYVESSMEGRKLYEREGFVVAREQRFDMSKFGRPDLGTDTNCIMIRPPRSRDGEVGQVEKARR